MYDERADIEHHKKMFESFVGYAGWLGHRVDGYELGLDVGGGPGSHAPCLLNMCKRAYITDIVDYSSACQGKLWFDTREKFRRNGVDLDVSRLEFHQVDAQSMIYRDGLFDLVVSFDAFEHIPDPAAALEEIARVTKPGGLVALTCDPLWYSPYGHHVRHLTADVPWMHVVMGDERFTQDVVVPSGLTQDAFARGMNRVSFRKMHSIFSGAAERWFTSSKINYYPRTPGELPETQHPNYEASLKLGHDPLDLVVRGFSFVAVRK